MASENLIVVLDAKTAKIDGKIDNTKKKLNQLDDQVKKTDISLRQMTRAAVVGATAAAAAITVLVNQTAQYGREIQIAANRTKVSVEEMQALAFASNTVGISLEKLGDIGKDTNEKIGEFLATGGGGFVDFIDVMKLTRKEGNELARTFQDMSGTDVLQEMVKQMEAAGISSNQMSFALEGLASDATDLIPLLSQNADELNRLKNEFAELGVTLSQEQLDNIKKVGEEFSKLGETFGAEGRQLVADYSDELITAIESIKVLAEVSVDAFNLIATGWGNIIELSRAALTDLVNGTDTFNEILLERTQQTQGAIDDLLNESSKSLEIVMKGSFKTIQSGTKEEKQSLDQRLTNFKNYTQAAAIVNAGFLEDNKAIKAGLIIADTAAAVMMQLSSGDPYTAFGRAALAAAMGAVQLSNALSATKGGGSVSGGGGGGASDSGGGQQRDFTPETSDLSLTTQDESSNVTVTLVLQDGQTLGEIVMGDLEELTRQGR